jgi:hypothetical protein
MKHKLLIVFLLSLALGTADARTSAPDISGTWAFAIERPAGNGGTMNVSFVFKQQGEKLTGTYTDPVRHHEKEVTGTVKGEKAVFSWELKDPSNSGKPGLIVTFTGTIASANKMTGTVGSPYCGGGCKWTATRQKK